MHSAFDLLFIAVKVSFVNVKVALYVIRFFSATTCSELKILYLIRLLMSLVCFTFSTIFEKDVNNEIGL